MHTWIALFNPSDSHFDTVRGYLKLGVSLLHENDKPVDLTKVDLSEAED